MTRMKSGLAALLAVLLTVALFAGATPAASMSDEQLVQARTAAMKQNGQILRGAKELSGDKAVTAASTILKNFKSFPGLFREGSLTPDSRATAKIWQNWADFTNRLKAEEKNAEAMLAAAKAGDKKAYEAAISALKKPCSSCHLTYGH
jgi:cytochrome c556